MTRRLRMNKLVSDFFPNGAHQIAVDFKKSEILMVRAGGERVDLDGVGAPVLEKSLQHLQRQLTCYKLPHECRLVDFNFPSIAHFPVQFIDNRLGLRSRAFLSQFYLHRITPLFPNDGSANELTSTHHTTRRFSRACALRQT